MKSVAETERGRQSQIPSMGRSIKWKHWSNLAIAGEHQFGDRNIENAAPGIAHRMLLATRRGGSPLTSPSSISEFWLSQSHAPG